MLYRYIAENDTHQKTSRKAPLQQEIEQHPQSSTSHQVVHAFEQPQQHQQQLWQPHPRYWPAQPVASKVSVFNSMDVCWVQQKFPQAYQDQQSNSSQQQQTQQETQQNQGYTLTELQPVQRSQASGNSCVWKYHSRQHAFTHEPCITDAQDTIRIQFVWFLA